MRRHDMPFGAQMTASGVRFRLWAPGCAEVALELADEPHLRPMRALDGGWPELVLPHVRPGVRYRFQVNDGFRVPDPASRCNPDDVHGASEVIDPGAYDWQDGAWRGRPWEEAVIYELHVGTFSPEGSFDGVRRRLDYLADLGVTAIELMPVADFPGARNWGYDGALPFAPDSRYGRPASLKALVEAAHARNMMVLLDVVYNHFGPEGNYLHVYAHDFFSERQHTPWGAAINFDGAGSREVREFFIQNALYWLEEYHFDGLRLDAVHAIRDDSAQHILAELAERVHARLQGARQVHLVLENDANEARYLGSGRYAAQWNDDLHHALHVLCSSETDGYYADYADDPVRHLGRCLAEGFAYQGEPSGFRGDAKRGEPSAHLPPQAFVGFLQSHDQVGNRAFGERITRLAQKEAVRAAAAIYLLAPGIPLLFMGEEFGAPSPFLFFCDFGADLCEAVTQGRRREFGRFARFASPAAQALIPDPNSEQSFLDSKLDWGSLRQTAQAEWLALYRELIRIRRETMLPLQHALAGDCAEYSVSAPRCLRVAWRLADGSRLQLDANLSQVAQRLDAPMGRILYANTDLVQAGVLHPWSVVWSHVREGGGT